jgi:hypothetical protein
LADVYAAASRAAATGMRGLGCVPVPPSAGRNAAADRAARLWVPETLHTSCDLLILVEQSAEPAWRASQIPAMLLDRLVLCALVRVHQMRITADAAGRCGRCRARP